MRAGIGDHPTCAGLAIPDPPASLAQFPRVSGYSFHVPETPETDLARTTLTDRELLIHLMQHVEVLGKQVGDTVRIQIPGGVREMEIVELKTIHDLAPKGFDTE